MSDFETMGFRTTVQMIADHAKTTPERVAMRQKRLGIWHETTWAELHQKIQVLASALIEIGVQAGDKLGILSENRQEWVLTQFAAQSAGATVVGMYPTSPAVEIAHLIHASDTRYLFIEDQEQFDKIAELGERAAAVKQLVVFDPKGLYNEDFLGLTLYDALYDIGSEALEKNTHIIAQRNAAHQASDTALMVFTSGSTGPPKAAEISHGNLYHAGCLIHQLFDGLDADINILSYLPLCHVAEQNVTVINGLAARRTMNFGESLRTINDDLRDVAPELFFGVPRIWEKMHASVLVQVKTTSPLLQFLTQRALASAERRSHTQRSQWSFTQKLTDRFWDALIYRHIRSWLGLGRLHIALTAAAPIAPELLVFFRGIGVNIREIWGMTETTGAATIQPDWGDCLGRVGYVPNGLDVRVAEDGELLIKGGTVFKGYYQNPQATASTLIDGWLHTGDIAIQCTDGSLSIVDRKKDIMITAAGKNLSPSLIENTMKASPYIKECIVIAEQRPYATALIQIDFETMRLWAEENDIVYTTFRSLAEHPKVVAHIDAEVHQRNQHLARVEQIKKVRLLHKELDHDDGEVTATMKVRRSKITEAYSEVIEGLYKNQSN